MNLIGKTLVVFIAVASVTFMGYAAVLLVGGPNYQNDIDLLKSDYRITNTGGDEPQWEAYQIVGEERVGNPSPSLPAVLSAAYDDALRDINAEIAGYQEREQTAAAAKADIEAANAADLAALQVRSDTLRTQLEAMRLETEDLSRQVQGVQDQVLTLQDRLEARRTDVFRLQAQYEEIYVDQYRAEQIIDQLQQLIHQIDGDLERARRREAQLIEQGATLPGDGYEPEANQPNPGE